MRDIVKVKNTGETCQTLRGIRIPSTWSGYKIALEDYTGCEWVRWSRSTETSVREANFDIKPWNFHSCFWMYSRMHKRRGTEMIHFVKAGECDESLRGKVDTVCIRYTSSDNSFNIITHKVGECPYSSYKKVRGR